MKGGGAGSVGPEHGVVEVSRGVVDGIEEKASVAESGGGCVNSDELAEMMILLVEA